MNISECGISCISDICCSIFSFKPENYGYISLGKVLIRILNSKPAFCFFGKIQKKDNESYESVRDEDLMD